MAVGPITYLEIDAYIRRTLPDLTAWDVKLIRRIDIAVRAVANGIENPTSQIPAKDGKRVGSMLRGLAKAKAKQRQTGDANA